jgi:hypothetical protein
MQQFLHAVTSRGAALLVGGALAAFLGVSAWAASHSDAPLIKQDPQANITDV